MVRPDNIWAVLILPKVEATRFNGRLLRLVNTPRLTIPTLAANTPSEGVSLKVIDENVEDLVETKTLSKSADIVGISVMTPAALRAYEIADMCKNLGIKVVLGGIHPTVLPEEALAHADVVVRGPGGSSWAQILADFRSGQLKRMYDGNSMPTQISPLQAKDRQLVTSKSVYSISAVQTSQGCPNNCSFCSVKSLNPNFVKYDLENVIGDINNIEGRYLIFIDDNLWADKKYAKRLFSQMRGMGKRWTSQAPISIALDEEILSLAGKAGCIGVYAGIDSVIEESLRSVNKRPIEASKIPEYIQRIQEQGIFVEAGVIFGFDNEDYSVFERTLEFYDKTSVDSLNFHILTPYPGTELRQQLEKEGRIIHNKWDMYNTRNVVFKPAKMSPEQLQEGYEWAWEQSFSLASIGKRVSHSGHPFYSAAIQLIGRFNHAFETPTTARD